MEVKKDIAISIIIPVYNAELFLDRCIQSILNQTFENFELILIDDCSQDNSKEICKKYQNRDPRVKFYQNATNMMTSATQNRGINLARGKYLMFCDNDDYVANDWCERLYRTIEKYPNALVASNYCWDNGDCKEVRRVVRDDDPPIFETSFFDLFKNGGLWFTWNKIFRRDIFVEHQLCYKVDIDKNGRFADQDVVLVAEYSRFCDQFIFITKPLYFYYKNVESITRNYRPNLLSANLIGFEARFPNVDNNHKTEFCDIYFSLLIPMFNNIFDHRNKMGLFSKFFYNQKAMRSSAFRICIDNMTKTNKSRLYRYILEKQNYYLYHVYIVIHSIIVEFKSKFFISI